MPPMTPNVPLPCLPVAEVRAHFALSRRTVYTMIKAGDLPAELFGHYAIAWPDIWACEHGPTPRPELLDRYRSDLLTRHHLAALTRRSLSTVDRWLARGLPTRNVRDSVRLNALDAADWLAGHYGVHAPLQQLRKHAQDTLR